MKIAVTHLNLGIGGSERLIVTLAKSLLEKGNSVTVYTCAYDENYCFEETKDPRMKIIVCGKYIPFKIFNGFQVLLAIINYLWLSLMVQSDDYDVVITDIHPFPVFAMRLIDYFKLNGRKYIYYCHYPDQLLVKSSETDGYIRKNIYRSLFNWFESFCLSWADFILFNSIFTKKASLRIFPQIRNIPSEVLYPPLPGRIANKKPSEQKSNLGKFLNSFRPEETNFLLSINRFEIKKNIELAIKTLKYVLDHDKKSSKTTKLIIAGGYDSKNQENSDYLRHLKQFTEKEGLKWTELGNDYSQNFDVFFVKGFSDHDKNELYSIADCLLYTPSNEHFGIVPIEAMSNGVPVIAVNSGGPLETVLDEVTGYLAASNPKCFGETVMKIINCPEIKRVMGANAKDYIEKNFSESKFAEEINKICKKINNRKKSD